jgi:hypothetical protein
LLLQLFVLLAVLLVSLAYTSHGAAQRPLRPLLAAGGGIAKGTGQIIQASTGLARGRGRRAEPLAHFAEAWEN